MSDITSPTSANPYLIREIYDPELLAQLRHPAKDEEDDEGGRADEAVQEGTVLAQGLHKRVALEVKQE